MADSNVKILPNSIEAEKSVLGALLVSPDAILDVINIIKPDDFYRKDHQTIYEAMLELFDRNQTIDVITVSNILQQNMSIENIGGIQYLGSLAEEVPLAANAAQYAKIVAEKSTQRRLIKCAQDIAKNAYEPEGDVTKSVEFAEQSVLDVLQNRAARSYVTIGDVIPAVLDNIEKASKTSGLVGIPSGFYDLDKMTNGFQNSNLVVIAGRPGAGKTAFMLNIARHVAVDEHLPVAIFNLEMSKEELATRILSTQSNIESKKLKTGQLEEADWIDLGSGADSLMNVPIYIDDATENSIQAIRSKARKLKMERDIKLIVIDYLQLMSGKAKTENRATEVAEVTRGLKVLAKELNVPVLVGSQLNRESEKRADKRPQLSELRESGSIEQDADLVILMHRNMNETKEGEENQATGKNIAELNIAKQRNGETGPINLYFEAEKMTFKNISYLKPQ